MKYGLPIITVVFWLAGFLFTGSAGIGVAFALIPNAFAIGLVYDKLVDEKSQRTND